MKTPVGFNSADYQGFSVLPEGKYNVIIHLNDTTFKTYDSGAVSCAIKLTVTDGPMKGQSANIFLNNYFLPDNDPNKERQAWDWRTLSDIIRATNNGKDEIFDDTAKIENKPFIADIKQTKSKDGTKTYYRLGKCEAVANAFNRPIDAFSAPAQNIAQTAPWGNGNIPF